MKRLFYGVSVVALVLAASFSFVSCKDYVQDELTVIRTDLYEEGGTVDNLKKELARVESEYKEAIQKTESDLKSYINAQDSLLAKDLLSYIDKVEKEIYEKQSNDSLHFEQEIDALENAIVDTLAYYVTKDNLTEAIKDFVTREELKKNLDSIQALNNARLDADSIRIDSLWTLFAKVEKLEAAISTDESGNIVFSAPMTEAVNKAVQTQIETKAAQLSLEYAKADTAWYQAAVNNAAVADTAWYQAAMDSLNTVMSMAQTVHQQTQDIVDSLHNVVLEKIAEQQEKVDALKKDVEAFKEDYSLFSEMCRECLNLLQSQIDDLSARVNALEQWKQGVDGILERVEDRLTKLENDTQITSIILQGTYNNVFGSINLPFDIQSMLVAGHYGKINADGGEVTFPEAIPGITPAASYTFQNGDEYREAAGLAYLTVNPNTVNLDGVKFELVNSRDETIGFNIDTVFKSNTKLSFGWTRANNGFYAAAISLDEETSIDDVKPRIDFSDIKSVLKAAIKDLEAKKMIDLKSIARVIYENSSDILDATAIKATWTDSLSNQVKSVYTNYNMAATVMKPLGFEFDGFDAYADKFAEKLKKLHINTIEDVVFDFNMKIDSFKLDPLDETSYNIVINGETFTIQGMADLTQFVDKLNLYYIAQSENQVNELIGQIKDQAKNNVDSAVMQINNNYVSKVNNYINKYNNYLTRLINKLKDVDFNHYLQPCMLICTDKHFGQVSSNENVPTFVKANDGDYIILTPTSYTSELIAPAMYKYIAVTNAEDNAGNAVDFKECNNPDYNMNVPFQFKQQVLLYIPKTNVKYEINYQAIDWSGKTVEGTYYIQAYN